MLPAFSRLRLPLALFGALSALLPSCSRNGLDGTIVFQSNRDGNFEIYTMNSDGTVQRRLTSSPANDITPRFSPDGTAIAFASDRDGTWEIYTMRSDGSQQTRLTRDAGTNTAPAWTPDGRRIVFVSTRDTLHGELYVMDADGRNAERLTRDSTVKDAPTVSPTGGTIVFTVNDRGHRALALWSMNDHSVRPITSVAYNSVDPAFADADHLLFVADRDGNPEVYRMTMSAQTIVRLTATPGDERFPCPTGDPQHIFYSKKGAIAVYSLQERSEKVLSFKGDSSPHWHER
jgi:TolB protein